MKGGEAMKKIALVLIFSLLLSFGTSIVVSAETYSDITPRYANAKSCLCSFVIENDILISKIQAVGIANTTSSITVKVTVEKRVLLGLWWNEYASWESTTTNISKIFEFTTQAKSGTYRCNFEVTFEGSGGNADVITQQLTATN